MASTNQQNISTTKLFTIAFESSAFPARPFKAHCELVQSIGRKLLAFYGCVGVPAPAPDKCIYRDIHFIVCQANGSNETEQVRLALGSRFMITEGTRISRLTVPIQPSGYVLVSIERCADLSEYHRIICFRAYGDLGMILKLLAHAHGLSLDCNGLKIQSERDDGTFPTSFHLSSSFSAILAFMGLSEATWLKGFDNRAALLVWIETSRLYNPWAIRDTAFTFKVENIERRELYNAFLERVTSQIDLSSTAASPQSQVETALTYFGKKAEYDAIVEANIRRRVFTGYKDVGWTGLLDETNGVFARLCEDDIASAEGVDTQKVTKDTQRALNFHQTEGPQGVNDFFSSFVAAGVM